MFSFSKIESAAARWFASLFSGFDEVESVVHTAQTDPLAIAGIDAAKTVVSAELSKLGHSPEVVDDVGSKILSGLAGISAAVPTVKAVATDAVSGLQLAGTVEADVNAAVSAIRGIAASHAATPAQPATGPTTAA